VLQSERGDWTQVREGRCHVRAYNEIAVLRLVWRCEGLFAEAVKIEHTRQIERLLLAARAAKTAQS
jgi:hypothetical protein